MTAIIGFGRSFDHEANGMTRSDMQAAKAAADALNEVIIFRSTGPWAMRWLDAGCPSKNFHVKGKSSDWGPQAGLVPYDGVFSKVGANDKKAKKGTGDNIKGIASGFVAKTQLVMSKAQIKQQAETPAGGRMALDSYIEPVAGGDMVLIASRSGDGKPFAFRAVKRPSDGQYGIESFDLTAPIPSDRKLLLRNGTASAPLLVMTSAEVGAKNLPMTGDYNLWAVCPSWADYGSLTSRVIEKPGIALTNGKTHTGARFEAGVGLDNVLDTRNHTAGTKAWHDLSNRLEAYRKKHANGTKFSVDSLRLINDIGSTVGNADKGEHDDVGLEHNDMGNLTPRILRCINELNKRMGATGDAAALRRVHHNAESHRYKLWFALTSLDMITKKEGEKYGDGFPLTVFQPGTLYHGSGTSKPTARYGDVCTLEKRDDFREYAAALKEAGYYVPKNWIWDLADADAEIRRRATDKIQADYELDHNEEARRLKLSLIADAS